MTTQALTDQLPKASYIRLALFPAHVTPPSPTAAPDFAPKANTKAFVTDSYLVVVQDSPTGPQIVLQEELVDFQGNPKTGYSAETPSGTYHIIRSKGCGCGSRLRGFHPFRSVPYRGGEYV